MKKEQILLVCSIGIAAVIVASNTGLYAEVGTSIPDGKSVESSVNARYDPRTGLPAELPKDGRAIIRERRVETRPPLPQMEAPEPLPPIWVRLLPSPAPGPGHWAPLRDRIAVVAPPAEEEAAVDPGADDPLVDDSDPLAKKAVRDMDKVARVVLNDGSDLPAILSTIGAMKGEPNWEIIRKWPNVEFQVQELNKDGTVRGVWPTVTSEYIASRGIKTVHLLKNCDNEYWERRVRERISDNDRGALMEHAAWTMTELAPRYGQEAVKMAVKTAEEALAIKADLTLVRQLGAYYRAAYDFEGELALYENYWADGNRNDSAVLELLAATMDRAGAYGAARKHWQAAVAIGSVSARIGLAENLYASGELDAARGEFQKAQAGGRSEETAHAFEGEARILINQGQFVDALKVARRGKDASASDPDVHNTLGCALYYNGQYAEAATSFRAAMALSPETHTRPLSNLGMALVAQGKLAEAKTSFEACLEKDALNFVDPLLGIGEVLHRQGSLTEATDYYETALQRDPNNAWILLRLGTAKLASGVSDRALELASALVAAAPGCVDGLRLAGLAIAAQEGADLAKAMRHLERARQKEPKNVDLLRRYVVALLQAGQKERALSVLKEATAPGTGFARRDGRTMGLLAYCLFINRAEIDEVREAIDNAKRATIDDAAAAYLDRFRDMIDEWDSLRIWKEEFRRAGTKLFGGWVEDDGRMEIAISSVMDNIKNENYAVFNGRARAAATDARDEATSLSRTESASKIREWEAGIRIAMPETQVVMHLYKGKLQFPDDDGGKRRRGSGAELAFVVDRDGQIQIWSTGGTGNKGLAVIDNLGADGTPLMWPMDDKFHTVRMVRTDQTMGKWQIYFDDEPLGPEQEIASLAATRNTELTLGFQVDADRSTKVDVHIDRVQILRTVD